MRQVDESGYWILKANPISRVGVFDYLGSQIDSDGRFGLEPSRRYGVLRPDSELFNSAAMESMEGIPFIDNHEMLGDDFTPVEKRPSHGTVTRVRRSADDPDTLIADVKIYTRTLKDRIESGKKGLSLGYYCAYVPEAGVWNGKHYDFVQRNLRGNHLALVERPRNDVYVQDSVSGGGVMAIDSAIEEEHPMDEEKNKTKNGGESPDEELMRILMGQDDDACRATLDFLHSYLAKRGSGKGGGASAADGQGDIPPPPPAPRGDKDGKEEDGDGAGKEPSSPPPDSEPVGATPDAPAPKPVPATDKGKGKDCGGKACDEALRRRIFKDFAAAQELAAKVSALAGAFDSSEMTETDVAVYGCRRLGIAFDEAAPMSAVFAIRGALKFVRPVGTARPALDTAPSDTGGDRTRACAKAYFGE